MAQSLSKIHIRMNAFALPGRTTQHIHTIPRVSLRLPWAMRSLGFAMHYWLHLSNSSMLDCIRFERSFSPFETKSETLVKTICNRRRRSAPPTPLKCCFESKKCKITCMNSKDIIPLFYEVTKIVYFIGNEHMLIAHDSNRLRFS